MAPHDPKRAGFCVWVDRPDGSVECRYCRVIRRQPTTRRCAVEQPDMPKRPATLGSTPPKLRPVRECRACVHLGDLLRLEPGECCGGKKTQHKVFACDAIGECQIGTALTTVTSCRKCGAFESEIFARGAYDKHPR